MEKGALDSASKTYVTKARTKNECGVEDSIKVFLFPCSTIDDFDSRQ